MFIRAIKRKKKNYYYIARTDRIGTRVVQKSILYIGTADSLYKKLTQLKKEN